MAPFQQKCDGRHDRNDGPNQTGTDVYDTHVRKQKHDAGDQKKWAGNAAVQGAILKPVGHAPNRQRKQNCRRIINKPTRRSGRNIVEQAYAHRNRLRLWMRN